jgi:hypothetical protein
MANYAIIENGKVVNLVVAEADYAATQGWVACPDGGIGWDYINGQFVDNRPKPDAATLTANARALRDALLAQTDWTQAADVPQATKDKWAPYRQALRDVPQQPGFFENIQWPAKPE